MFELPATGGCRCGRFRFSFDSKPFVAYTCHCRECRKLTGSAFLTCMHIPAESLTLLKGDPACDLRQTDSGNSLITYFCNRCGENMYAMNSARPFVVTLHVGSLDKPEKVEVNAHIWLKQKLSWVEIPDGHRRFDESGDWLEDYKDDPSKYGE